MVKQCTNHYFCLVITMEWLNPFIHNSPLKFDWCPLLLSWMVLGLTGVDALIETLASRFGWPEVLRNRFRSGFISEF